MKKKVKKDFFTRISSKTLENLAKVKLSPTEWQTIMALVRKTYGWQKVKDRISITQFEGLTELPRKSQCRALKGLVGKNIVIKEKGYITKYSINKNYDEWLKSNETLSCEVMSETTPEVVSGGGKSLVSVPTHTIDTTIDNRYIETTQQDLFLDDAENGEGEGVEYDTRVYVYKR